MYTVTKEKIDERPDLPDGNHKGSLIDITDTVSKIKPDGSGGHRMFRFSWNILLREHTFLLSDFILPEHPNEIVRKIARKKISLLGGILLNIKDGEEFDLYDCRYKQALLEVKSTIANDGNTYPRIISIKHLPLIELAIDKSHNTIDDFDVGDDEIPF